MLNLYVLKQWDFNAAGFGPAALYTKLLRFLMNDKIHNLREK